MNKLLLTIQTFFIFLSVYGQNGLNSGNLFLLQKDDNTVSINSFENEKINEINTFKISEKSIYTTDQKERVIILDTVKNNISIFNINSSNQINLSIPFEIKPKTILLNNENIFVGGEMGKEILVQYHLKNEKWYQLEIPNEVIFFGKAVDDLVINDSLLIAVDNIIMPKYILYYHLNAKDKLKFSHFKELKSNSSYESIHQARISEKYLGLLSTTMNHGTVREHITLYADLDLRKSFAISVEYKGDIIFKDLLIIDNKLFIANSFKGLGILDIKNHTLKKVSMSMTFLIPK
ncbi:MAG: hypothetical protein RBT61_08685 [Candidatus Kapabacteria bacterium]|jgi:hypothetical protein|nr:hypothetical protein [Candidatus Kapabacteria bacterium]